MFKVPRSCNCGYSTSTRKEWYQHRRLCGRAAALGGEDAITRETPAALGGEDEMRRLRAELVTAGEQLAAKDEQLRGKDEQIAALLAEAKALRKRTRTVNTTTNITKNFNVKINVFGHECLEYLTDETLREMISESPMGDTKMLIFKKVEEVEE